MTKRATVLGWLTAVVVISAALVVTTGCTGEKYVAQWGTIPDLVVVADRDGEPIVVADRDGEPIVVADRDGASAAIATAEAQRAGDIPALFVVADRHSGLIVFAHRDSRVPQTAKQEKDKAL